MTLISVYGSRLLSRCPFFPLFTPNFPKAQGGHCTSPGVLVSGVLLLSDNQLLYKLSKQGIKLLLTMADLIFRGQVDEEAGWFGWIQGELRKTLPGRLKLHLVRPLRDHRAPPAPRQNMPAGHSSSGKSHCAHYSADW